MHHTDCVGGDKIATLEGLSAKVWAVTAGNGNKGTSIYFAVRKDGSVVYLLQ